MRMTRFCLSSILIGFLAACSHNPAPVIDRLPEGKAKTSKPVAKASAKNNTDWRPDTYTVKKGDTLFSIGLEHGYDYKEVAQANDIKAPYTIKVGQVLKFSPLKEKPNNIDAKSTQKNSDGVITYPLETSGSSTSSNTTNTTPTVVTLSEPQATREPYSDEAFNKPISATKPATNKVAPAKPESETKKQDDKIAETKPGTKTNGTDESNSWLWPAKGKIIGNFNENGNKGIDIAGSQGQAIQAAAAGKVIYTGSDLRGYGKLVIIKHNSNYLSVYANNNAILVKEGQAITAGQKIAEMGSTDSNTVKLHFEIREQGKSVDPVKFLAAN